MAKKNPRKPTGAAAIRAVEDDLDDLDNSEGNLSELDVISDKPKRTVKPKVDQKPNENVGIGDIKKAATFANSVGGLDKAMALLQILKVAKDVQ